MDRNDQISFHSRRAMEELDMALKAADERAAHAHFILSSLHVERMRMLNRGNADARVKIEA